MCSHSVFPTHTHTHTYAEGVFSEVIYGVIASAGGGPHFWVRLFPEGQRPARSDVDRQTKSNTRSCCTIFKKGSWAVETFISFLASRCQDSRNSARRRIPLFCFILLSEAFQTRLSRNTDFQFKKSCCCWCYWWFLVHKSSYGKCMQRYFQY